MFFLKRDKCVECGNPEACGGKYMFLVLYDIIETSGFLEPASVRIKLNQDRATRCKRFGSGGTV